MGDRGGGIRGRAKPSAYSKRRKAYIAELDSLLNKSVIRYVGSDKSIKIGFNKKGNSHLADDVMTKNLGLTKTDLPKLNDYLREAQYDGSSSLIKERKDNIVRFYYFKDNNKNVYYNVAEQANKRKNGKIDKSRFLYAVTKY